MQTLFARHFTLVLSEEKIKRLKTEREREKGRAGEKKGGKGREGNIILSKAQLS